MGLVVLIVIGGLMGWLALILGRWEDHRSVVLNVAMGIAGALLAGVASNSGPILKGLSAPALLTSILGAIVSLILLNAFRRVHPG